MPQMLVPVYCPACHVKAKAPPRLIGRKAPCPACGAMVTVMVRWWYYKEMGQEKGPVSPQGLVALVKQGQVGPETPVRKGPYGRWAPACKIRGLFSPSASSAPAADPNADPLRDFCPTPWASP
jgi:hypothetical protein